ncbi:unnamed protein product [Symbiodinium sp. CCMP2456]|nr:unnamed protein product [Symbiodinium sp. CCMP2456]
MARLLVLAIVQLVVVCVAGSGHSWEPVDEDIDIMALIDDEPEGIAMIQRDARLTAAAAAGCGDDNCPEAGMRDSEYSMCHPEATGSPVDVRGIVFARCFRQMPTLMAASSTSAADTVAGDATGLLLIEHLNLNVLSTQVALEFYEALGCCRDARRPMNKTLHSNCGSLTQFHTPSPENEAYIAGDGAQTWRGHVELLYDSLDSLQAAATRVAQLREKAEFQGTSLAVGDWNDEQQGLWASDAYGNKFALRVASNGVAAAMSVGIRPGTEDCKVLGIGSVTLQVPPGTAERGAKFYAELLGFSMTREPGAWALLGGPQSAQRLRLEEHAGCSGQELGEHLAIYIQDFDACFERLLQRGLIWVNPRFVHLDKSTNLDEARKYNCFRFKDIVDLETGEKLFELEHEVRSTGHKSCPLRTVS